MNVSKVPLGLFALSLLNGCAAGALDFETVDAIGQDRKEAGVYALQVSFPAAIELRCIPLKIQALDQTKASYVNANSDLNIELSDISPNGSTLRFFAFADTSCTGPTIQTAMIAKGANSVTVRALVLPMVPVPHASLSGATATVTSSAFLGPGKWSGASFAEGSINLDLPPTKSNFPIFHSAALTGGNNRVHPRGSFSSSKTKSRFTFGRTSSGMDCGVNEWTVPSTCIGFLSKFDFESALPDYSFGVGGTVIFGNGGPNPFSGNLASAGAEDQGGNLFVAGKGIRITGDLNDLWIRKLSPRGQVLSYRTYNISVDTGLVSNTTTAACGGCSGQDNEYPVGIAIAGNRLIVIGKLINSTGQFGLKAFALCLDTETLEPCDEFLGLDNKAALYAVGTEYTDFRSAHGVPTPDGPAVIAAGSCRDAGSVFRPCFLAIDFAGTETMFESVQLPSPSGTGAGDAFWLNSSQPLIHDGYFAGLYFVGGNATTQTDVYLGKLGLNGQLSSGFGTSGYATLTRNGLNWSTTALGVGGQQWPNAMTITSDGNIAIAGRDAGVFGFVALFSPSGALIPFTKTSDPASTIVDGVIVRSDNANFYSVIDTSRGVCAFDIDAYNVSGVGSKYGVGYHYAP